MQGLFPAKVINNNDLKKKGRVQIKIEFIHYNLIDSELPWAVQSSLGTGGSNLHGKSSIPEKDSFVWVWFEDVDEFKRYPYYLADIHFSEFHPHNLFEDNIKSSLASASVYPNTKYTYYPNGVCIGVDSSSGNPEIFLYTPNAFMFINKDGQIEIKGGTVATEFTLLGETLKLWLETHTHPTGVGPSGPPAEAADLVNCLSTKVKHN
jgi:hypothetical protein